MAADAQAAGDILHWLTGGGGAVGGATGAIILQRLMNKTNGNSSPPHVEISELLLIAKANSQSLHNISDGINRLNETFAEIKGAFSQIANSRNYYWIVTGKPQL